MVRNPQNDCVTQRTLGSLNDIANHICLNSQTPPLSLPLSRRAVCHLGVVVFGRQLSHSRHGFATPDASETGV